MFIAQVLEGPSKQLKQIIQTEHNIVKDPNCLETNQLAIYKRGRRFELGATEKQIQVVVRAGLEPVTTRLRVRQADHSAFCLLIWFSTNPNSQKYWVGVCGPLPKTFTLFMTKICNIPYPIYDLTKNSKPNLWPDLHFRILFQTCIIISSVVQTNFRLQ